MSVWLKNFTVCLVVIFIVSFSGFIVSFRYLTDDLLEEPQKMSLANSVVQEVPLLLFALSAVGAVLLTLWIMRASRSH